MHTSYVAFITVNSNKKIRPNVSFDVLQSNIYRFDTYGLILGFDFSSLSSALELSFFDSGDFFSSLRLSTGGLFGDE